MIRVESSPDVVRYQKVVCLDHALIPCHSCISFHMGAPLDMCGIDYFSRHSGNRLQGQELIYCPQNDEEMHFSQEGDARC